MAQPDKQSAQTTKIMNSFMVYFAYCVTDNAMIYEHGKPTFSSSALTTEYTVNLVTQNQEKPTNVYTTHDCTEFKQNLRLIRNWKMFFALKSDADVQLEGFYHQNENELAMGKSCVTYTGISSFLRAKMENGAKVIDEYRDIGSVLLHKNLICYFCLE